MSQRHRKSGLGIDIEKNLAARDFVTLLLFVAAMNRPRTHRKREKEERERERKREAKARERVRERERAEVFDDICAYLVNLEFHGKSVCVPSKLALDKVSRLVGISAHHVLDGAGENVSIVRLSGCERRPVVNATLECELAKQRSV